MIIKQISIFAENRPGRLSEITDIIAKNNINLRALSIADTTNFGILRIIADDPDKVEQILKENEITVSVTGVIAVCVEDRPGGLAGILKTLAEDNIDIEYMYAFVSKQNSDEAYVIMRIEEDFRAMEVLKKNGYEGLDVK
ncbi:MAG: ACT domain-containing protein [Oscillospiraceae bacterium]|nr:ACT domain-containing protein [Oscillospiraceae bacterium]